MATPPAVAAIWAIRPGCLGWPGCIIAGGWAAGAWAGGLARAIGAGAGARGAGRLQS